MFAVPGLAGKKEILERVPRRRRLEIEAVAIVMEQMLLDRQDSIKWRGDIPYDVLVQTMDNTRVWLNQSGPLLQKVELFPDISVGDAPLTGAAAAGGAK